MRKYFNIFFGFALLTIAIGTSSCFDIFEEYEFNADGSGKATMIVDVSKMVDMMSAFGDAMDSTGEGGDKSMDQMFDENETYNMLKSLPGITNVQNLNDKEKKQIGYSFEFKDIEALNSAQVARGTDFGMGGALGMGEDESAETEKENSFAYTGKKFVRKLDMKMDPQESEDDEEKQYAEMAMMMFKDAKYNVKYTFERSVKKVKGNEAALVGADKKSVTIENNFKDLLDGTATMNTEIRLK
ncbi:MAG TPA: hypothetical protein VHS96_17770 [Bacteroidia bacterium]|nr:hypothetical protein [Bacteroidia bacterium]